MSNLFSQLSQAAQQQRQELQESRSNTQPIEPKMTSKPKSQPPIDADQQTTQKVSSQREPTSSHSDATKSKGDNANNLIEGFDDELMVQIVKELSIAKDNYSTTLRISPEEKKFSEDFIHVDLRRKDVEGNGVSKSKLMRYAFAYVMLKHRKDFLNALVTALKEEKKIGLLT
ncbi:MAG: hypothetical protein R2867_37600 [Caldilineaceae bacterium]